MRTTRNTIGVEERFMTFDIDLLARTPDLRELEAAEARVAMTLRLWVVMNKLGPSPLAAMRETLDSRRAAAHLTPILAEIGAAWPEPFCVNPPYSPPLSHYEAPLPATLPVASSDARPG